MSDWCNWMVACETLEEPPCYCDEQTVDGAEFCERHLDEE